MKAFALLAIGVCTLSACATNTSKQYEFSENLNEIQQTCNTARDGGILDAECPEAAKRYPAN